MAQQKKRNHIGDAIIAERQDEDEEGESAPIADQQVAGYRSKTAKIALLADETTKQYKLEQKELGIKKETDAIITKARLEQRKVETSKLKLRQTIMGGVISNNLATVAQRLVDQRAKKEEETKPRNSKRSAQLV